MAGGLACALAAASAASACLAVTAGGASREALGLGVADELTGLLSPVLERARRGGEQARARKECLEQMPVMIDVVVLGLSAGLSFDSSLELYCSSYGDALARGLAHALLSWRIGAATREEAFEAAAGELGAPELARFGSVVCESLAFGSPLAEPLERQAQVMRDEQRSLVEEEIERVPVKMLIPLGTLIVPAMLLAILGPLLGGALRLG